MEMLVAVVNTVVSAIVAYCVARYFGEVAGGRAARKYQQYERIIDWLVSMKRFLEGLVGAWEGAIERGGNLWEPKEEDCGEFYRIREKVERVVIGGDYVISGKALRALSRLVETLSRVQIVGPVIGGDGQRPVKKLVEELRVYRIALSEVESCFGVVRAEAKRDRV
jgi:hypothetical protein